MDNVDAAQPKGLSYKPGSDLVSLRKRLHSFPELGFCEFETAKLVAEELRLAGIQEIYPGIGGTGVLAVIRKGTSGRCIAIRADMDALPMAEASECGHASQRSGIMHACGHDGHTAILVGAARDLATRTQFDGTVILVFQPAEEGLGGAARMIEDGLFERFQIDQIFGLHNWPPLQLGQLAIRSGTMTASVDRFDVEIRGRGAHAAQPHTGIDPIVIASEIVATLQTIVSRHCAPSDAAVVSITQISAGTAYNVIPDKCLLKGTVRSVDGVVRKRVEALIRQMIDGVCTAHGAECEITYQYGTTATINAPGETEVLRQAAIDVVGKGNVLEQKYPTLGGEDFGTFLEHIPGAYIFLGTGRDIDLHHPQYDFNDQAIEVGVRLWCRLVERCLPSA